MVPFMQEKLQAAINYALAAIAADVRRGLLETVGLDSEWWTNDAEWASVVVHLPENIDVDYAAEAINLEISKRGSMTKNVRTSLFRRFTRRRTLTKPSCVSSRSSAALPA